MASVDALASRLASDVFKVLVIGEFKRGKSTFINALLREEVLPAFATPCTAVINEIKYGDAKEALLHFRPDADLSTTQHLPEAVQHHAQQHRGGPLPPLNVPVEDLEDYVVIPDPAEDQARSVASSPYDHVEIQWPIDLCRNGVELIDSPGLNEHGTRSKITTDYLAKVDAILFVMSCQALGSQSELAVVDNQIRAAGHTDIFFIANRFDEIRPKERERIVSYAQTILKDKTGFGTDGIFFISALDALEGRLAGDAARVAASGIENLEEKLSHFLVNHRGRLKLLRPVSHLSTGISKALSEIIPGQRSMLQQGEAELRQRYDNAKPALEDAQRRRDQIVRSINLHRERLRGDVKKMVCKRQEELASALPEWLKECEFQESISMFSDRRESEEAVVNEVVSALSARIEAEQVQWQQEELRPVVEKYIRDMIKDAEAYLGGMLKRLDNAVSQMTGAEAATDEQGTSSLDRVLAVAGELSLGNIGVNFGDEVMSDNNVMKTLAPHIALAAGMLVLGVTNPFVLIPALLGSGWLHSLLKVDKATAKAREKVAEAMGKILRDKANDVAQSAADDIFAQTQPPVDAIGEGLDREIQSAKDQVEIALANLEKGEAEVNARLRSLNETSAALSAMDQRMRDLMIDLAANRNL
ncbi:MAG: dynamin family protein [Proteobacteria bacterium]|nr:dynamin family protein [Pseudomonadota bacterium]